MKKDIADTRELNVTSVLQTSMRGRGIASSFYIFRVRDEYVQVDYAAAFQAA